MLEKILVYCAQNNISMDELVKSYKEKQKSIPIEKEYVNFPIPEDMIQSIEDVYMTANEYVQCVASHLCPHCRKECHPKLNDKWLWNDCLVSRISMIMLSHIMLVQEKLEFHDMRV